MSNKISYIVVVAVFLTLFGALRQSAPAARSPITIAALLCLSGPCAEWGENARRGITLAIEQQNAAGGLLGRNISLLLEDTAEAHSGAQAVRAFKKLRSHSDAQLFIGPSWTPAGLALAPIAAREDVIMISPSLGVADFNEHAENLYNTWPHDATATRFLATHAYASGLRRVSILASEQPWERQQAEVFQEHFGSLGGTVVQMVLTLPNEPDLKTAVTRMLAGEPEFVYLSNVNQLGHSAREIRKLGFDRQIYAALLDETRIKNAAGALEDAISTQYTASTAEFVDAYTERFGETPGVAADTAYDAAVVYLQAIKEGKSTLPEDLKSQLKARPGRGASGSVTFDAQGGVVRQPVLARVHGGKLI